MYVDCCFVYLDGYIFIPSVLQSMEPLFDCLGYIYWYILNAVLYMYMLHHAYVVVYRNKMFATDSGKASWKEPVLEKFFIDLCIEEVNTRGKRK